MRQNIHIGICNGPAMEKVIQKGQTLEFEKEGMAHWPEQRGVDSYLQQHIARLVAIVAKDQFLDSLLTENGIIYASQKLLL